MTAFTLGEAAAAALVRMGGIAPARRGSLQAGSFEDGFFVPPAKGETDRLLRVARAALDAGRRLRRTARAEARALTVTERALAGITAGAVRVYEELLTLARLNRGRVYPSYDHLARATALGRATVARGIGALEAAGFVIRQRRFHQVDGTGAGPRRAQTSNVYRPTLPQRLLGLIDRLARHRTRAPIPVDAVQKLAEEREETRAMLATLSCRELVTVSVGGALGRALEQLGARIDAIGRESHDDPETVSKSIHTCESNRRSTR